MDKTCDICGEKATLVDNRGRLFCPQHNIELVLLKEAFYAAQEEYLCFLAQANAGVRQKKEKE